MRAMKYYNQNKSQKLIIKMGNIEIKERPRKNYSIFGNRQRPSSRSPFKDVVSPNSPYYKDFSPIRYSPLNKERRTNIRESLQIDTSNKKVAKTQDREPYFPSKDRVVRRETERIEEENAEASADNREKCEEIIRKVRNFNDFLVELKRKLKEDCAPKDERPKKQRGQVSLSVKLENQRVELEKYKKLVQRQLSKTHSIENISIQNTTNGEKILTIQYEDLVSSEKKHHGQQATERNKEKKMIETYQNTQNAKQNLYQVEEVQKSSSQLSARLLEISKNTDSNSSHASKPTSYEQRLKEAKALWNILKKKTYELAEMMSKQQQKHDNGQELRDYLILKQRLVKINDLYSNLESANRQSIEVEKKIKGLLA